MSESCSVGVVRVCAAILAGVCAGAIGIIVSPGPLSLPWLGIVLAAALVASGSVLAQHLAGAWGILVYAFAVFSVTLWCVAFSESNDMLTLPDSLGGNSAAHIWPLLSLVCAVLPGFLVFQRTAHAVILAK